MEKSSICFSSAFASSPYLPIDRAKTRKGNDERGIKGQPASANFARTAGEWNCGSTSALARGLHLGATLWVSDADPVVLCVLSFPTKVMPIQRVWPDAVQPTGQGDMVSLD
ncbi:Uncharacterized protein Fot_56450 [Forsythia ovata]|uniref:Uncharacterized protein n=1 Tax=Forsythia ovata TaxID=205694 RepID=A0ABD1NZK1_9LAMI